MDEVSTIYGLRVRGDTEVRYVGRTVKPLAHRLYGHLNTAKAMTEPTLFASWLREHGQTVEIFEISRVAGWSEAKAAERDTIRICLALNHKLFNFWLVPPSKWLSLPRGSHPRWKVAA